MKARMFVLSGLLLLGLPSLAQESAPPPEGLRSEIWLAVTSWPARNAPSIS